MKFLTFTDDSVVERVDGRYRSTASVEQHQTDKGSQKSTPGQHNGRHTNTTSRLGRKEVTTLSKSRCTHASDHHTKTSFFRKHSTRIILQDADSIL
ncbi:hypothetical protein JTE90_023036 [Oedothorax gibbosus]|uniref:Uncharacterized protein n=1 Tax=Oedothorax gibbosus TaxID=931172 RepID=A0AAV6V0F7_9ARAC|nr:hypothetical protein JTE90_023036 [Oedothorax gibbosus]